jgi:hypothetical protein
VQQHLRVIAGMARIACDGWSRYWWCWGDPCRVTGYWPRLYLRSFAILMMILI